MNPLRWTVIAVFGLVLVACSSGDDDVLAPLETIESPTTSVEETTVPTSASSTTTASTIEETTTSASAEVARPELDPANWETDLDEIFGRYLVYWDALRVAQGPPEANPDYEPLAAAAGPEMMADARASLSQFRADGRVFSIPEGSLNEHNPRLPIPVSLDKVEGNEVVIQDCWIIDHQQLVDGEVVDERFTSTLLNATMKVIDGDWRVFAIVTASDDSDGWDECIEYFRSLER